MAGRWKIGKDGSTPEWEELAPGVNAPNQVAPPGGAPATTTPAAPNKPATSASPWDTAPGINNPWSNERLSPGIVGPTIPDPGSQWPAPPPDPPPGPNEPYPPSSNPSPIQGGFSDQYGRTPGDPAYGQPYAPGDVTKPKGDRLNPGDPGYGIPGSGGDPNWKPTRENVPPGFDIDKWVDPNKQDPKYIVGRILASGGSIQDAANAIGATVVSRDTIRLADGTLVDVLFGSGAGINRPQWNPQGDSSSAPPSVPTHGTTPGTINGQPAPNLPPGARSLTSSGTILNSLATGTYNTQSTQSQSTPFSPQGIVVSPPSTPTTPPTVPTTPTTPPATPPATPATPPVLSPPQGGTLPPNWQTETDPLKRLNVTPSYSTTTSSSSTDGSPQYEERYNSLFNALLNKANQSLDISSQDPIIANQVNAFRAEQERGARNYIASLAEKQGPMANLQGESRLAAERASQATGGMQATLMQNELTARRQEIMQALTLQASTLSDQEKNALTRELGLIDAALRQQQITNQNNQFLDQLGLDAQQQASYWDWVRSHGSAPS